MPEPQPETPLPSRTGSLLEDRKSHSNLSLIRDRGAQWTESKGALECDPGFLSGFIDRYKSAEAANREEIKARHERRRHLFQDLARRLPLKTRSRLVIGLGLPQSGKENTALLLDRLTGLPYIPGSSVKGLARHAAREVSDGWLEGDRQFWTQNRERLFGSQSHDSPAEGAMAFYDAFPSHWPDLELDVLTPHYRDYYQDKSDTVVPGDWENPVPIQFLTVRRGVEFEFFFRSLDPLRRQTDEEQTDTLLRSALDWIGAGGKKSAGYGSFDPGAAPRPHTAIVVQWEGAVIEWVANKGKLKISSAKGSFETAWQRLISEAELNRIKKARKPVTANVDVRQDGNLFEAVRITIK